MDQIKFISVNINKRNKNQINKVKNKIGKNIQ